MNRVEPFVMLDRVYAPFIRLKPGKDIATSFVDEHLSLLVGCATPIWLTLALQHNNHSEPAKNDGSFDVLALSGLVSIGIGDSLASIVGTLLGEYAPTYHAHFWPNSKRTIEGTIAFVISVYLSLVVIRSYGVATNAGMVVFDPAMLFASTAAGLLEAITTENDNIIIPVFMFSIISQLKLHEL